MNTEDAANFKPFYLLKVPYLVLERVINLIEPYWIMDLVECSKRMRSITTLFTTRQHHRLHLHFNFGIGFEFAVSLHSHTTFLFKFKSRGRRPHRFGRLLSMKKLVKYFQSVYTITFEFVEINLDIVEICDPKLIYDWLNTFGDKIQRARIYVDGERYGDGAAIETFLDNFQFSKLATMNFNADVEFKLRENEPIFAEDLIIEPAYWVTQKYLTNLENSLTVVLEGMIWLLDWEINNFLRNLVKGSNPKLEYLKLNLKRDYNEGRILKRIVTYREDSGRVYRRNGIEQFDKGGQHFRLDNGDTATIFFYPNQENPDAPSASIGLVIWRNENI